MAADESGATLNINTLMPVHFTTGYAVAKPGGLVVDATEFTPQVLKNFAELHRGEVGYVGTWSHEGKVYLDLTTIIPERALAVKTAQKWNQLAIYGFAHGGELVETTLALKGPTGQKGRDQLAAMTTKHAPNLYRLTRQRNIYKPGSTLKAVVLPTCQARLERTAWRSRLRGISSIRRSTSRRRCLRIETISRADYSIRPANRPWRLPRSQLHRWVTHNH
jgi:hypothetical protein